jgi:hypothetical protein
MLRNWLEERSEEGERPGDLDALDVSQPVGQLLLWLHRECIFDIDETRAAARARRLAHEEAGETDPGWGFLEELTKDELRLDPRVDHYRHAGSGFPDEDELLGLLRVMLGRTPEGPTIHLVHPPRPEPIEPPTPGTPWSMQRRLEVRVFNVLERWCGSLNDPRFVWIEQNAPVRNYVALLTALGRCWQENLLPVERILRLLETLFSSFIGGERTRGYLPALAVVDQAKAIERLPDEARFVAASLLYTALRDNADWKNWVFRLQPALEKGLELGVIAVGDETPSAIELLVGERPTVSEVEDRLLDMSTFTDDEHWCERQERELGIERVELTHEAFNPKFGITLAVTGMGLDDPRLVCLVRQALIYRHVDGAVVETGSDRVAVHYGDPVYARIDGAVCETEETFSPSRLVDLERAGVSFRRVLGVRNAAA